MVILEKLKNNIYSLLNTFKGKLPDIDIENIDILLSGGELFEGFDVLCTQLYEYDIQITKETYENLMDIGKKMLIKGDALSFLQELTNKN